MYYSIRPIYYNELYHNGIKGQKWGIRRFQNLDGSLTPEGKKRYNRSYEKKIDDEIDREYDKGGKTERNAALAAIKRMSTRNALKTAAGAAASMTIIPGAVTIGAAAAAAALHSTALLTLAAAAPAVTIGAAAAATTLGLIKNVKLSEAKRHYKY